jgi:hypothetical protein
MGIELKDGMRLLADSVSHEFDAGDDVRRGQIALRRRRARWSSAVGGVSVAAVCGVLATQGAPSSVGHTTDSRPGSHSLAHVPSKHTSGGPHHSDGRLAAVKLVAKSFDAPPFTFGLTPEGWVVGAKNAYVVTIVPADGSVSNDAADFEGKLVITFSHNPPGGREVVHNGRQMWIVGDSGYTGMSTRSLPGEPEGLVHIQFPDDSGWSQDAMLDFLASVHVTDAAKAVLG